VAVPPVRGASPRRAAALVLGLLLSLALGRFASLAAVAVLSAGGTARTPAGQPLEAARAASRLGAAALFAAVVVLAPRFARPAGPAAPDYAVVPTGFRVRVLASTASSAAWPSTCRAGEMPALARLLAAGARARLRAEPERVPRSSGPRFATGRGPEAHGIQSATRAG